MHHLQFFTFLLIAVAVHAEQTPEKLTHNPCVFKTTCRECIQTPSCAWCFSEDSKYDSQSRCFQPSGGQTIVCPEEYTFNPNNVQQILMAKELSKAHATAGGSSGYEASSSSSSSSGYAAGGGGGYAGYSNFSASAAGEIIQVSPQRIRLELRARQSYTITMSYTQAKDYPVDLYYLMDLSKSMEDDKAKLSILGNLLVTTMRKVTSDFRLGFGSFVDKVVMPYVSTVPKKLLEPCTGCEAPYGYRNHMTLSTNTSQFSEMVDKAAVSGNLDAPEGGFDALMQAIVCRNEIGWRERARRLLVFSTDAGFHYAGDGKLGGIITPNDGECHLRNGLYTHSDLLDYPSISQINLKVKQNAINVIFAVTESQIKVYKRLQQHIEGSSCGQLSNDSSNIVDLVKNQYDQISSTVEMKDNATGAVKISYYTRCMNTTGPEIKTNKCEKIRVGDVVDFKVRIEFTECPQDPRDWNQIIQLYPVGLNESLIVDLNMLCSCPCEKKIDRETSMTKCKGHGDYVCGVCQCHPGYEGRFCDCSTTDMSKIDDSACIKPNTSLICSGRGTCSCGKCKCDTRPKENERIYGDYCECTNFNCEQHGGLLCGGPEHSDEDDPCDCGQCKCKEGWEGPGCMCSTSKEKCFAPKSNLECSGHGKCECGKCKCFDDYYGALCEKCPKCPSRCEQLKDCVYCQVWETDAEKRKNCTEHCKQYATPKSVKSVNKDETNQNETLCSFVENDCTYYYVYYFDENNQERIDAEQEPKCPVKVIFTGVIFGVIAAIVLMGMALLLLWKILTTIHDRREFAKFEKERSMAKWDASENPIYKQATSTFKNPTYAGKG